MPKVDISVGELVDMINRGELRLPELQRRYVWPATRVRDLLDSLYRGYPSGTILVWETDLEVPARDLAVAQKHPVGASKLLLDGQQRLTSLSAVLRGEPLRFKNRVRPVEIAFNLEHPEGPPVDVEEVEEDTFQLNGSPSADNGGESADDEESTDDATSEVASVQERARNLTFVVASRALLKVDEGLWALLGEDAFFVDALNPRFWLLHTTAPARALKTLVRTEFVTDARLDSAWMPRDLLDRLEGVRHWMQSSFESDTLLPSDGRGQGTRRWRVQVEGDAPEELLALASQVPRYAAAASLSAVGSILREPGVGEARVVGDYKGAFIATGASFDLVAGVLWRTMDRYEKYVKDLEKLHQLRINAVEEIGLELDGDVAVIDFPVEVDDLEYFVDALFNAKEPFRLWAVPRKVADDEWEANAVDLHVGQTLRLEITPRWLRVLLDGRTCGNTLARLVTNLQHRFHAQTELQTVTL